MAQITGTTKGEVRSSLAYARTLMAIAKRQITKPEGEIDFADLESLADDLDGAIGNLRLFIEDAQIRLAARLTPKDLEGQVRCWCGAKYWEAPTDTTSGHRARCASCFTLYDARGLAVLLRRKEAN